MIRYLRMDPVFVEAFLGYGRGQCWIITICFGSEDK